jgi:hypothetical protein
VRRLVLAQRSQPGDRVVESGRSGDSRLPFDDPGIDGRREVLAVARSTPHRTTSSDVVGVPAEQALVELPCLTRIVGFDVDPARHTARVGPAHDHSAFGGMVSFTALLLAGERRAAPDGQIGCRRPASVPEAGGTPPTRQGCSCTHFHSENIFS